MRSAGAAATLRGQAGSPSIDSPDHWWYVVRTRLLETMFGAHVPAGARVLDVGSADGPSVDWMRAVGIRVCVDIDPRGLGPGGVCADALRLPFDDGAFDVVAAFDVIEHFADEGAVVAELTRVLRPGGALLVSVPAYQWAWSAHDVATGHHRRYTRARLRAATRRAGLRVERVTHAFAGTFPLFAADRVRSRLRRPTGDVDLLPPVPPVLERLLLRLGRLDEVLLARRDLPFGSSILLRARKAP